MNEYATEVARRNAECLEQIIALLGQSFPMLEIDLSGIHADWRRELSELDESQHCRQKIINRGW